MQRISRFVAVVALVSLTGVLTARAEPRTGFQLESRIPSTSLVFASFEDVAGWEARINETALGRLMNDPEMQAFMAPAMEALNELAQTQLAEMPPLLLELLQQMEHLKGQLAISLVAMQDGPPDLVASLDFGDNVQDFVTFLARLKEEIDPQGEHIRMTEENGRPWWAVDTGEMPVFATIVDTAFLASTTRERLDAVIAEPSDGSLGASVEFRAVRGQVGGSDLGMLAYANVTSIMNTFGSQMPEDMAKGMSALGLDTIRSAAYGMAFKGDGFQDTLVVHAPGADHGLLPILRMEPMTRPRTLRFAPSTAFYWSESTFSLSNLIPRVRDLIAAVEPGATAEMDEFLGGMARGLGVDIERDILGGLDDSFGAYAAFPETGGLYPEFAVILKPTDPVAYEDVFSRFANGLAGMVNEEGDVITATRTMDYRGRRMHLFEMQAARGDDVIPFTPTWCMLDGHLVVTLVPHTMKEIILRTEDGTNSGLAGQADFQAVMANRPPGAGAVEYLDLQGIMALVYDTLVPLLQTAAKPNVVPLPVDWALLPPARRMIPYFRSFAEFAICNEQGLVLSFHGPIPMMPLFAAMMAGMWASMARVGYSAGSDYEPMMPFDDVEREMDLQLAQVQAEMLLEAADFFRVENNRPPKDLKELVSAGLMDQIPSDPWGGDYRLRVTPPGNEVMVESAGPDRVFGTPDDVRHGR